MSTLFSFPDAGSAQSVPLVNWHDRGAGSHTVQFYSDDRFLIEPLARFIGTALEAGDAAVIIATEHHRSQLSELLHKHHGEALSAAIQSGRFVSLDAARTLAKFMRDAHPDPSLFSAVIAGILDVAQASASGRRVAAFGEMVALLWAEGHHEAAIELEQLWNDLARRHAFSLHCAYPLSSFQDEGQSQLFLSICSQHSSVIPDESYTSLPDDQARLRNIVQLQQKAQALEFEKGRHASLLSANETLQAEAAAHQEQLRKLGDSEQSLRELSNRLIRSQEDERRRLGMNLHDSVGQHLAVLKMALDMLNSRNAPTGDAAKKLMAECIPLLEHSIEQLRAASYLLYPPMIEETGLPTAIRWYLTGFTKHTGIRVTFDIAQDFPRLPGEIELALFRALQESLANVHRHSGSSTAVVALRSDHNEVRLDVCDHGKGIAQEHQHCFDPTVGKLGLGLRAIQERLRQLGGTLQLSSTPQGTTFAASVRVPA
jgi:signal transduction histidine kinase